MLIGGFALAQMSLLSEQELNSFDQLLDEADNDLLSWIMGRDEVPARVDLNLINQIILFNNGP